MTSKPPPSDKAVPYDPRWLKEENDRRSAEGQPPLRQRKRKAVERERLRALRQIVSPMAAADINPDYELVPDDLATRQPARERARRALKELYGSRAPDEAALSNKALEKAVNEWLEANSMRPVAQRTIRRAAGRR
jgi:hypothetical protein